MGGETSEYIRDKNKQIYANIMLGTEGNETKLENLIENIFCFRYFWFNTAQFRVKLVRLNHA